jgi:hypothetical protein
VFDSFFKKQEAKLQHLDLGVNEQYIIGKYCHIYCFLYCLLFLNTLFSAASINILATAFAYSYPFLPYYITYSILTSLFSPFLPLYSALDGDDERILKVLKKNTDTLSLFNLSKAKKFLLAILQNLQFSTNICSIVVSTVFAISKSIARITAKEYKNIGGK